MKPLANQILYQYTCPTSSRISARFGTIFNALRQFAFLRFGQAWRTTGHILIFQSVKLIRQKIVQPVVDRLLRHIPDRQDRFQRNLTSDHQQHRQMTDRAFVATLICLVQFLLKALDIRFRKRYSKHGMSPFALDCRLWLKDMTSLSFFKVQNSNSFS